MKFKCSIPFPFCMCVCVFNSILLLIIGMFSSMQGISNGHDFHSMLQRFEKISLLHIAKTFLIIFIMLDNKILDVIS